MFDGRARAKNAAMATDPLDSEHDDVGDRVIDDVRKTARHLESQLHQVKGRISRQVMEDLRHGLSQLRLLGPASRRGAPDDQPMHLLTAAELGFELHLGDQMVNRGVISVSVQKVPLSTA